MRNGHARRRLALVVIVSLTRVGGGGCSLGCGLHRAGGGRLATRGGEELRRAIKGGQDSLVDLLVDSLDTTVIVGVVAGVVNLSLLGGETFRDMHDWSVAVGVVALRGLAVGEVVGVVVVVVGSFGNSHAAKDAAMCAVVVTHGCWLACEVARKLLDRAERGVSEVGEMCFERPVWNAGGQVGGRARRG